MPMDNSILMYSLSMFHMIDCSNISHFQELLSHRAAHPWERVFSISDPQLIMVHDKPRHPQCQISAERASADIKYMLVSMRVHSNICGSWMFSFLLTHKAVGLVEFNNFCRAVAYFLTKVF